MSKKRRHPCGLWRISSPRRRIRAASKLPRKRETLSEAAPHSGCGVGWGRRGRAGGSGRGRGDSASRLNFPAPEHLLVSANHKLYRLIKHRRPITRASSHPCGRRNSPPPPPLPLLSFLFSSQDIFSSELFLRTRTDAAEVSGGKGQICHRDYTFPCLVWHRGRHAVPPYASPQPPSPTLGGPRLLPSKPTWTRNYC